MTTYAIDVTIKAAATGATFSWTVDQHEATVLPAIADGLSCRWAMPEADVWPVQPEPVSASFAIIAASAADVDDIDVGDVVHIAARLDGATSAAVRFAGRVAQADGSPAYFQVGGVDVQGWRLDLQAVDYTADLAETEVGDGTALDPNGQGSAPVAYLIPTLFAIAGLPYPDWGDGGTITGLMGTPQDDFTFPAGTLLDVADMWLAGYADAGDPAAGGSLDPFQYPKYAAQGWRRGIIRSNLNADGTLVAATPYRVEWVSRLNASSPTAPTLPGKFGVLAGGRYGVTIAHPPANAPTSGLAISDRALIVDASYVDRAATWTRTKLNDPNKVIVQNPLTKAHWPGLLSSSYWRQRTRKIVEGVKAAITARVTSYLVYDFAAGYVGDMYLDSGRTGYPLWQASTFKWYASKDPTWNRNIGLFPDAPNWRGWGSVVIATDIPATQRPNPTDLLGYAGVLSGVEFVVEGGEYTLALDIRARSVRTDPTTVGATLTWANAKAKWPTVKWEPGLDNVQTWKDARLARSTATDY